MKTRLQSIDLIKVIAMFAVMGLHSTLSLIEEGHYGLADIIYGTSVVAIPLFFMVSGFLLLGRENADYKYAFYKIVGIIRYIAIICVLFFIAYYSCAYLLDSTAMLQDGDRPSLPSDFFGAFIQKGRWAVFWYFGAMIILYLCLPLLNRFYNGHHKGFVVWVSLLFCVQTTLFILDVILGKDLYVIQTFRLWNWLFYFSLGGIMKRYGNLVKVRMFGFVILFIVLNLVCQQIISKATGNPYGDYYCSPLVECLCIAIFLAIQRTNITNNKILATISPLFLPVYTFHLFVIAALGHLNGYFQLTGFFMPLLFWLCVCVATILFSFMLMKIPFMDKIFKI